MSSVISLLPTCVFKAGYGETFDFLRCSHYLYNGNLVKKPCCSVDTFPGVEGDNGTNFSDSFEFLLSFIPLMGCSLITYSNNLTN